MRVWLNGVKLNRSSSHTVSVFSEWVNATDRFLDMGCGDGAISCYLERELEYSDICTLDVIDYRKFKTDRFAMYDGVNLPFSDNSFDVIGLAYILHHVPNEKKRPLLEEVVRVTKKKGRLVILEDTPVNILDRFISYRHGMDFKRRISQEDFGFYTQNEWEEIFLSLGLRICLSKKISRFCCNWNKPHVRSLFVLEKI